MEKAVVAAREQPRWPQGKRKTSCILLFAIVVSLSAGTVCSAKKARQRRSIQTGHAEPALWTYRVKAEYPHDARAFTQGLQFDQECDDECESCFDVFWESTGLNGRSSVRQVELSTGIVRHQRDLGPEHFGEGSTRLGDHIYMITWQTGQGFKFSRDFKHMEPFDTGLGDGWGLTNDGTHLIVSESSQVIHWLDPATMKEVRSITVTDRGHPIRWMNELEVVGDELWGNIWQTECIARVNMTTGVVVGWIHLHGLRQQLVTNNLAAERDMDVLNGIAYDAKTKRIFVTGKLWPRVFEVELVPFPKGQQPTWQAVSRLCWPSGFI